MLANRIILRREKMKLFNKRNLAVGIIALIIGLAAVFVMTKVFGRTSTTVTGSVTAFILNSEGKPDGVILDTGEQIRFGADTGALVASQIKVGDQITVTGYAGDKSEYGRELRAETLQIGGQTINVIHDKRKPQRPGEGDKPKNQKGEKRRQRSGDEKASTEPADADAPAAPVNADAPVPPMPAPRETLTANGTVKTILVGGHGEARGLILSDGTQIMLPKEVAEAQLTFNEQTSVSVEGEAAKSDFGTFINPTRLTVGDRTFSVNHSERRGSAK